MSWVCLGALSIASGAAASVFIDSANTTALSNGLVGDRPLDGRTINWTTNQFNDLSGLGLYATSTTMSTTTSPVAGKIGGALNFNGTTNFLELDWAVTKIAAGDVSMSAWIYLPTTYTSSRAEGDLTFVSVERSSSRRGVISQTKRL